MDAASVNITVLDEGKSLQVAIDVPMRSIDAGTFPALSVQMAHIRILSQIIKVIERIGCRRSTRRSYLLILEAGKQNSVSYI